MDNLGVITKVEYAFVEDVRIFAVNNECAIVKLSKPWVHLPVLADNVSIKSTPNHTEGITVYSTTGTINISKSKSQNIKPLLKFNNRKIILKITTANNEQLVYGDRLHPIYTISENITPNTAGALANFRVTLKGEDTHGALPLYNS